MSAAANSNTSAIVGSRPAISIGGQDQPALSRGLLGLNITETTAGLYRCEMLLGNWGVASGGTGYRYFDRSLLDFGKSLGVSFLGQTIFQGVISALEGRFSEDGQPEIAVLAEDRLQSLRMTRRTQTFENVSDSDLFNTIANAYGLTPSVDVEGPQHKVIAQVNQSDLALIRERARAIDAEVWMDGSTLHVQSRAHRQGASLTLGYRNELRELVVLADLAHQRTSLVVSGWDVSQKDAIACEATDSVLGTELGNDTSGASLVRSSFGERKETIVHTVPWTSAEAQARADAHFRAIARTFVNAKGVAETNPGLRVGAYVSLTGIGPLFEGDYYVTEVSHLFDGDGLRTEFAAERPGVSSS